MFENMVQVEAFFMNRKQYGIKPGLERVHYLLHALNHPEEKIRAVHVAGTNGKGSTIHFLKQALMANGYHVGVFTSPSISGLTGHIFTNDQAISETTLLRLLNDLAPAIAYLDQANQHPTEFEIMTVLAFYYFAQTVDIALIETGMGGREDTTNCFKPILSIITTIDKDHMHFLGETITAIARHKAGIIKEGVPVITGAIQTEALRVLVDEANLKQAPVLQLGEQFTYAHPTSSPAGQTFTWQSDRTVDQAVTLRALGSYQRTNCSVALMALAILTERGFNLSWSASLRGVQEVIIPGRFEVIQRNPVVILDGAHNPAGIRAFLTTLTEEYAGVEKHLIFAAFKDKDLTEMLALVKDEFTSVTLTTFDHPRAASVDVLANKLGCQSHVIAPDWRDVMKQIKITSPLDQRHYFITGSLSFIASVRTYFQCNGK